MKQFLFVVLFLLFVFLTSPVFPQYAGREPASGVSTLAGTTFIDVENPVNRSGTLRIWRAYSQNGARVILKVFRQEGDRMVLVGSSALESVGPAAVEAFGCNIPVARGDYIGCFCPDVNCVDRFSDGLILSGEGDFGTTEASELIVGSGTPAIAAARSANFDIPSTASFNLVIPVVARTLGSFSTQWVTSLELFNTSFEAGTVTLSLNLSDRDNTLPACSFSIQLGPRAVFELDDLFVGGFQMLQGSGSVDLVSTTRIVAYARVFNTGSREGTYGQLVPAFPAEWAIRDDDTPGVNPCESTVYLLGAKENLLWRTNMGITNIAATPLQVEVTAFSGSDSIGEPLKISLNPYSHTQINQVLKRFNRAETRSGVRLQVKPNSGSYGRFFGYLSIVDNQSGDAVFIPGAREPSMLD